MSSTAIEQANGATEATETSLSPFGSRKPVAAASVEIESARAVAETQAAMVVAQRFPRDQVGAMDRILQAFTRPTLAEKAMYTYARGGTDVTGPSIRAAEAIAQDWGNIQFGVDEVEQKNGVSKVLAFAWDVETNTRTTKTFYVPHIRHTRRGQQRLEDPRDIYELVANQGARRVRACILAIVPGDVVEAAMKQAETTLRTKVDLTPERIQSMLDKFGVVGVTRRMIETKIQRRIEAITPALAVQLGKIYNSIEDGMSAVADHFELEEQPENGAPDKTRTDALAERVAKKKAETAAEAVPPHPETDKPVDEKKKRTDLRIEIDKAWGHVSPAIRQAVLTREYAKATLLDLTTAQLEDFLARTPELLPAPQE